MAREPREPCARRFPRWHGHSRFSPALDNRRRKLTLGEPAQPDAFALQFAAFSRPLPRRPRGGEFIEGQRERPPLLMCDASSSSPRRVHRGQHARCDWSVPIHGSLVVLRTASSSRRDERISRRGPRDPPRRPLGGESESIEARTAAGRRCRDRGLVVLWAASSSRRRLPHDPGGDLAASSPAGRASSSRRRETLYPAT